MYNLGVHPDNLIYRYIKSLPQYVQITTILSYGKTKKKEKRKERKMTKKSSLDENSYDLFS